MSEEKKSKRPSFQFYPADWLNDIKLKSCSLETKGFWISLICLMHQGQPYGHLSFNNLALSRSDIARTLGEDRRKVGRMLDELLLKGIIYQEGDLGAYFSPRMVKDEHLRYIRARSGSKGGKARFATDLLKQTLKQNFKQNPPSSSSSSSSSSASPPTTKTKTKTTTTTTPQPPKGERARFVKPTVEEIREYCTSRKSPINPHQFFDHYESIGWMRGKNQVKDWKATLRTWELKRLERGGNNFSNGHNGERPNNVPRVPSVEETRKMLKALETV